MNDEAGFTRLLGLVAVLGAIVGLGKLLASKEPLSLRLMFGRAIVGSGLAIAAGAILAFVPGLPTLALVGLASASATLGEQFLERLVNAKVGAGS